MPSLFDIESYRYHDDDTEIYIVKCEKPFKTKDVAVAKEDILKRKRFFCDEWGVEFGKKSRTQTEEDVVLYYQIMLNHHPTILIFDGVSLKDNLIELVVRCAKRRMRMNTICMELTKVSKKGMHMLIKMFAALPIKTLTFITMPKMQLDCIKIAKATSSNLAKITFNDCGVSQSVFEELCSVFSKGRHEGLNKLDLSCNQITDLALFGGILDACPNLAEVRFAMCPLDATTSLRNILSVHAGRHLYLNGVSVSGTPISNYQTYIRMWLNVHDQDDVTRLMAFVGKRSTSIGPVRKLFRDFDRLLGTFLISPRCQKAYRMIGDDGMIYLSDEDEDD